MMHGTATARALPRGAPPAAARAPSARPNRAARCAIANARGDGSGISGPRPTNPRRSTRHVVRSSPDGSSSANDDGADPTTNSIDDRPISVNAMSFDESGRLWVVEMRGYMNDIDGSNETEPNGRIVVLQDHDGDGRMDVSASGDGDDGVYVFIQQADGTFA